MSLMRLLSQWRRSFDYSSGFVRSTARSLSSIADKSRNKDWFLKHFDSRHYEEGTLLLECLANCTVEKLGDSGVDVISLNNFPASHIDIDCWAGNKLFVRSFYPDLLKVIREHDRSVLLGSPGTGKSFFQFYYLARIMNPEKFGPLPPDHLGSTKPPRIVIRQVGDSNFIVYDIEEKAAELIHTNYGGVLDSFDQDTSLYLMEPGSSKREPFFGGLRIPTFLTTYPMIDRYYQFSKNGGVANYLPVYQLKELQAIGKYLVENEHIPRELTELYAPDQIAERFEKFGGIFRVVLPLHKTFVEDSLDKRDTQINRCDASKLLLLYGSVDDDRLVDLIQCDVNTKGTSPFRDNRLKFVSNEVRQLLERKVLEVSSRILQIALKHNDEIGDFEDIAPLLFHKVVCDKLVGGVQWKKKTQTLRWDRLSGTVDGAESNIATDESQVWADCELDAGDRVDGELEFAKMSPGQICIPPKSKFPVFDMYTKRESKDDKKQELIVFLLAGQNTVTRQEFEVSAMVDFFERIGLTGNSLKRVKIRLVLIPRPTVAEEAVLVPNRDHFYENAQVDANIEVKGHLVEELKEYEVWQMPSDYSAEIPRDYSTD